MTSKWDWIEYEDGTALVQTVTGPKDWFLCASVEAASHAVEILNALDAAPAAAEPDALVTALDNLIAQMDADESETDYFSVLLEEAREEARAALAAYCQKVQS